MDVPLKSKKVPAGFWHERILFALQKDKIPLGIAELALRVGWNRPDRKRDLVTFLNKLEAEGKVEKFGFTRPTRTNLMSRRWVATSVLESVTKPGAQAPDWLSSEYQRSQLVLDFSKKMSSRLKNGEDRRDRTLESLSKEISARYSRPLESGQGIELIWEILKAAKKPLTAVEVRELSGMDVAGVYRTLRKLADAGGLSVSGRKRSVLNPLRFEAVSDKMPRIRKKRRRSKKKVFRGSEGSTELRVRKHNLMARSVQNDVGCEALTPPVSSSDSKFQRISWEDFQVIAKWEGHDPEVLLAEIINKIRG